MDAAEVEAGALRFMAEATTGRTLKSELIAAAIVGALLALLVGAAIAWATWPARPVPEIVTPAPQANQVDGSVIAARGTPAAMPKKPRYVLPKSSTEERRGEVVVVPAPSASSVQVDYSLVRTADGGRRMVFDSPDGKVLTAVDIPLDPAGIAPTRPWAAGLSYGTNRSVGLWVDRDLGGRLRVGAALQRLESGKAEGQLRVGVRW